MKGIMPVKTIFSSILFFLVVAFPVHAGWQLYDNFNSGEKPDDSKWSTDESSADIKITNGELQFLHKSNHPYDSSWVVFIDRPQTITGVRATMRVESCTGDFLGRIGGIVGQVGENYVWSTARISAQRGRIETYTELVTSSSDDHDELSRIFSAAFKHNNEAPLDITNQNFTIEWTFSPNEVVVNTDAFGDITFESDMTMSPTADFFLGLGTRNSNGDGPCSVYFDDVYVYRETPTSITAPQLLLLGD